MTTIICMRTDNAIYLASDSQVSSGNIQLADPFNKTFLLGHALISCCGTVGLCQKVSRKAYINLKQNYVDAELFDKEPNAQELAKTISDINFYLPLEFKRFSSAAFFCGGLVDGELKIYALGVDGSKLDVKTYASEGSGGQIALGIMGGAYKPEVSLVEGSQLIAGAIMSASKSDIYTNSKIEVHAIDKEGKHTIWDFNKEDLLSIVPNK